MIMYTDKSNIGDIPESAIKVLVCNDIDLDFEPDNVIQCLELCPDIDDEGSIESKRRVYLKKLKRNKLYITSTILHSSKSNADVVMLYDKKEDKDVKYMKILKKYIEERYDIDVVKFSNNISIRDKKEFYDNLLKGKYIEDLDKLQGKL